MTWNTNFDSLWNFFVISNIWLKEYSNSLTNDNFLKQGVPSASHVSNNMSTPVLPAPTAAPGNLGTVQGPSSGNTSSSSHSKASNAAVKLTESKVSVTVEASADSSKTDKASSRLRATYIILYMLKMKK